MSGRRFGPALLLGACLTVFGAAAATASPSDSLGDSEVKEKLLGDASDRCTGYKGAYAGTLQSLDVSLSRSLLDHHVLACPDPTLDPALAVVWYGNHRAITWNPNLPGSAAVLDRVIRHMARADDFMDGIEAFDAHGTLVTGQLVPMFSTRCADRKECG